MARMREIKINDIVITVCEDSSNDIVKGEIGRIVEIDSDGCFTVDFEPNEHSCGGEVNFFPSDAAMFEFYNEVKGENKMATSKIAVMTKKNASALKAAGKIEAGQIAINRITKMIGPKLPMMLRGYADTPVARIVIANLFSLAVQQYAPNNEKAQLISDAMMEGAMLEFVKSFNLDQMLDGVLDGIDMSKLSLQD